MDPEASLNITSAASRKLDPALEPWGWCWYQPFEEDREDPSARASEWHMVYVSHDRLILVHPEHLGERPRPAPRGYYLKVPAPEAIARLAFEIRGDAPKPTW